LGIRHADFGMKPYTALGGQLRVQEKMDLRFLIHAVPVERWGGGEGAAGRGMVAKGCGRSPRPEAAVGQGAPLNPAK
ncbi:MAG TPA: hypothetical protein VKA48_05880, partial [Gammaproteobacteria bacterium]|nr:hypothetical protein [Gammaproteobacteria bacterium]